jgi:hypothetical protein
MIGKADCTSNRTFASPAWTMCLQLVTSPSQLAMTRATTL